MPIFDGTFDQNGDVWEVTESAGMAGGGMILRGGGWTSFTSYLAAGCRLGASAKGAASNAGFRLGALPAAAAPVAAGVRAARLFEHPLATCCTGPARPPPLEQWLIAAAPGADLYLVPCCITC